VHLAPAKGGITVAWSVRRHRLALIDRSVEAKHAEESVISPRAMMELRRLLEEDASQEGSRSGSARTMRSSNATVW